MLIKQITNIPSAIDYKKTSHLKKELNVSKEVFKDRFEMSTEAKERISKEETFSVNNDKRVEEIIKAIENGTYEIDSEKLAKSMLKEMKE